MTAWISFTRNRIAGLPGVLPVKKPLDTQGVDDLLGQLREATHEKSRASFFLPCDPTHPVLVRSLGIGAKEARSIFLLLGANNGKTYRLHQAGKRVDLLWPNWNAIQTHFLMPYVIC